MAQRAKPLFDTQDPQEFQAQHRQMHALHAAGLSNQELAVRYRCCEQTVKNWLSVPVGELPRRMVKALAKVEREPPTPARDLTGGIDITAGDAADVAISIPPASRHDNNPEEG